MREQQIVFTYGELIDAFNVWNSVLEAGDMPNQPAGDNVGEMFTNYLITTINKDRANRLTSYNK